MILWIMYSTSSGEEKKKKKKKKRVCVCIRGEREGIFLFVTDGKSNNVNSAGGTECGLFVVFHRVRGTMRTHFEGR